MTVAAAATLIAAARKRGASSVWVLKFIGFHGVSAIEVFREMSAREAAS